MIHGKTTSTSKFGQISCIYNNFVKDAFFVKALMLSVVNKYGDTVVGATYRVVVTDLDDTKFVVVSTQLAQH